MPGGKNVQGFAASSGSPPSPTPIPARVEAIAATASSSSPVMSSSQTFGGSSSLRASAFRSAGVIVTTSPVSPGASTPMTLSPGSRHRSIASAAVAGASRAGASPRSTTSSISMVQSMAMGSTGAGSPVAPGSSSAPT